MNEDGGMDPGGPIQRESEDSRLFQKYSAGVRLYPARSVHLDVGGYYKDNSYDYDHNPDSTGNASGGNRYPAFLVMQDFETYDGYSRILYLNHRVIEICPIAKHFLNGSHQPLK